MRDANKPGGWSQQNLVIAGLLCVVIVLLLANLFRQQPAPVDSYTTQSENNRRGDDRKREEDPYTANEVKNTIIKGYIGVRDCYNVFIDSKPTVTDGRVMLDWTINSDGEVEKAELVSSEIQNENLTNCMLDVVRKFQFPPPPGGKPKYIAHKFVLKKDVKQE